MLVSVVVIAAGLDLRHAGAGLDVGGGVLSGALTMSAGVNGPPLVFVLQARHFPPDRFRGTITTVFVTLDVISMVVFTVTGDLDGRVLAAIAVALPGLAVGAAHRRCRCAATSTRPASAASCSSCSPWPASRPSSRR